MIFPGLAHVRIVLCEPDPAFVDAVEEREDDEEDDDDSEVAFAFLVGVTSQ